ncbi:MAG: 3-methylornithyl-N6-L-lysine dehydrogenase PylD [Desulfocucumaceae bacterium]
MTRLNSDQMVNIWSHLAAYDRDLQRKTGYALRQVASGAMRVPDHFVCDGMASTPIAVIPVTSGEGVIPGFVEAVSSIITYLGFCSFITACTDVSGIADAVRRDAGVIFMADDNRFVALNISSGRMIDNDVATARGYVFALNGMAGGLSGKKVLVRGAGRLGSRAVSAIKELGAGVSIFDVDFNKAEILAKAYGGVMEEKLEPALERHRIIFDASPAPAIIRAGHIKENTVIAAPGIPCGVDSEAYTLLGDRLVHDTLHIGVAAMLLGAVYGKNSL